MDYFRTHVEINLDAIRQNAEAIKASTGKRLIAVVKADAYGHGVVPVIEALRTVADMFAVATIEEGVALRQAGIRDPILVLFSSSSEQAAPIVAHGLTPTISDWEFADRLKRGRLKNYQRPCQYQYRYESERHPLDRSGAVLSRLKTLHRLHVEESLHILRLRMRRISTSFLCNSNGFRLCLKRLATAASWSMQRIARLRLQSQKHISTRYVRV